MWNRDGTSGGTTVKLLIWLVEPVEPLVSVIRVFVFDLAGQYPQRKDLEPVFLMVPVVPTIHPISFFPGARNSYMFSRPNTGDTIFPLE
jgi:hypothetical protein